MKSNVTRCVPTEAAVVERKTEGAHISDFHINNSIAHISDMCIDNSAYQRYERAH